MHFATSFIVLNVLALSAAAGPAPRREHGKRSTADPGDQLASSAQAAAAAVETSSSAASSLASAESPAAAAPAESVAVTSIAVEAPQAYPTGNVIYGSGSWPGTDLQSCLQECHAQLGGGGGLAPSPTQPAGGPATHTIIVAPTKGVLRFVPFSVDAEIGDKIVYQWGAGPHSATLSDGTNVCNKSTTAKAFDSGKLNATATFETMVTDKNASFHYCTVGTHCASGMFGVINPPKDNATATAPSATVTGGVMDGWISNWSQSGPGPMATVRAVQAACQAQPKAWAWGGSFSFTESTTITRKIYIENVLYTRLVLAKNPHMLPSNVHTAAPGSLSLEKLELPPDLQSFVATAGNETAVEPSASAGASAAAEAAGAEASASPSGAGFNLAVPVGTILATVLSALYFAY